MPKSRGAYHAGVGGAGSVSRDDRARAIVADQQADLARERTLATRPMAAKSG